MKALSFIFGAVATTIGVTCASSLALKAGQDYCSLTPPPNPFISVDPAEKHRDFCAITDTLSSYNPLYPYEQQTPPPMPTLPNVTIGPYSIDPYLGFPDS